MSKRVKSSTKKKPAKRTFKTLKAMGFALKAKPRKRVAHPLRPSNTRWPAEISIGKRHRKEFGDIEALALSYNERGAIIQPIAITADNKLIAGERRIKAWLHPRSNFRDQPIPVHVITVDSIVAGEWDENAHRKDFTPSEAVAIKREIEVLLKKHAKDLQRAHGGTTHGKKSNATDKLNVRDRAAAMTGKKRSSLDKAEKIEAAAEQDPKRFGKLRDDMNRTGRVDGPFKRLQVMQQTDALRKAPSPLPMCGPYMALSIDYPWPAERDAEQTDIDKRGRSMRDYPEMAIPTGEKLFKSKEFRALIAPDCTIYFWTTNFHMEEAFVLLNAMGFSGHSTIGTWVKNKMGRGQVLRGQTEHCIIATCGKPTINLTNQTTAWQGDGWDVREDSRKPDAFYAMVEELTPAPRYAEIFSRGGRTDKWDCHGDQAGEFTPAPAKAERKSKSVRRTLPGRDAELISFAEKNGHIVSMTIDHATNESVGTCQCGYEHREPRDELAQDDPEGVKLRIKRARWMDGAITEHWHQQQDRTESKDRIDQPTADEPATTAPAGNGEKSAKSAVIPAGDSEQLSIPSFLDRNALPTTSLTNPKLLPSAKQVKAIADRAEVAE